MIVPSTTTLSFPTILLLLTVEKNSQILFWQTMYLQNECDDQTILTGKRRK
jgi:hypothetical protein